VLRVFLEILNPEEHSYQLDILVKGEVELELDINGEKQIQTFASKDGHMRKEEPEFTFELSLPYKTSPEQSSLATSSKETPPTEEADASKSVNSEQKPIDRPTASDDPKSVSTVLLSALIKEYFNDTGEKDSNWRCEGSLEDCPPEVKTAKRIVEKKFIGKIPSYIPLCFKRKVCTYDKGADGLFRLSRASLNETNIFFDNDNRIDLTSCMDPSLLTHEGHKIEYRVVAQVHFHSFGLSERDSAGHYTASTVRRDANGEYIQYHSDDSRTPRLQKVSTDSANCVTLLLERIVDDQETSDE
jgi:hypothetical protein